MPSPEGQSLRSPSPDAIPITGMAAPTEIQSAQLPDLSQTAVNDEFLDLKRRQDDAEDALFARGAHNPNVVAATADMTRNSAGLTFANSPLHTITLGGPNGQNKLPNSPGGMRTPDTGSSSQAEPAEGLIDGVPDHLKVAPQDRWVPPARSSGVTPGSRNQ